jgi:hypothetical protein
MLTIRATSNSLLAIRSTMPFPNPKCLGSNLTTDIFFHFSPPNTPEYHWRDLFLIDKLDLSIIILCVIGDGIFEHEERRNSKEKHRIGIWWKSYKNLTELVYELMQQTLLECILKIKFQTRKKWCMKSCLSRSQRDTSERVYTRKSSIYTTHTMYIYIHDHVIIANGKKIITIMLHNVNKII